MAENTSTKDPCSKPSRLDTTQPLNTTSFNDILPLLPTEIAHEIFSHLGYRDRARCAKVSKSWRVIADDNQSYKNQFDRDCSDLPNRRYGENWASQQKWKLAYIHSCGDPFPHEEYTSIKAIPYHPSHATIERYWTSRTRWHESSIAYIAYGVNKPRDTSSVQYLAHQAQHHGVSYEVEEILLCRGYLRGANSLYPLQPRGKDEAEDDVA